jgi:hypothetical protein
VSAFKLPMMMAELTAASVETVWHRTTLMMFGMCSAAEYQRMVEEKMHASQAAAFALLRGESAEAVIKPYHKKAVANAKRLRRS